MVKVTPQTPAEPSGLAYRGRIERVGASPVRASDIAALDEKAPGGAPPKGDRGKAGFDSRGCDQGETPVTHTFKKDQVLTVQLQRRQIYSNDHYAPAERESTQKIRILSVYEGQPGSYGVKNLRSGRVLRFDESRDPGEFGNLSGGSDGRKHIRWYVLSVVKVEG
jgi:hypothetical protein